MNKISQFAWHIKAPDLRGEALLPHSQLPKIIQDSASQKYLPQVKQFNIPYLDRMNVWRQLERQTKIPFGDKAVSQEDIIMFFLHHPTLIKEGLEKAGFTWTPRDWFKIPLSLFQDQDNRLRLEYGIFVDNNIYQDPPDIADKSRIIKLTDPEFDDIHFSQLPSLTTKYFQAIAMKCAAPTLCPNEPFGVNANGEIRPFIGIGVNHLFYHAPKGGLSINGLETVRI